MKRRRASSLAIIALLSVALPACEQPATTAQAPVAARVNGEIISETELNRAVARLQKREAAKTGQTRGKVLEALVDQRLLADAARAARLDQAPELVLAMQQAQRQVLAEAYMGHLFKGVPTPEEAEIQDYYDRHPEWFAQRKLYRVLELDLQLDHARVAEMEAQLKQRTSLTDLSVWLNGQGITSKVTGVVRPAEQIPPVILAQLANMKDGQVVVVPTGGNRVAVLQMQGSQFQPVTQAQARDSIKRVLLGEKRKALLEAEIRKLRANGKIEYTGGFAPAANLPASPNQP